ncbi:MFS transporter [Streptosporangiaceae bacterium NEAU-GS5]|nr:MFS transporter [Streptosporangiaceae bacterium NEAU-GS5]
MTGLEERSRPARVRLRLAGLSCGYFMVLLDSSILNVALPDIARDLGGSVASLQWTINAYLITFGALLLSSGAISDRYGAARVFRVGVAAFAVASLLCALAPTLAVLVALRAVQGAAAALIPAATLALIGQLHPEDDARAKALGFWGALSSAGFASGPVIGGLLVGAGGWRTVFVVNLPLAVTGLVLAGRFGLRSPRGERRLDWRAQLATIVFLGLLTHTIIEAGRDPRATLLPGALAVAALAVLVAVERRSRTPAFPRNMVRIPAVRTALTVGGGVQFLMVGTFFVLGLDLLEARHLTPALAGLALAPYTIGPMLSPLAGRATIAYGTRRTLRGGLLLIIAGHGAGAAVISAGAPYLALVPCLLIAGFGVSFVFVPLTSAIVGAAPDGRAGVAAGLFNAARQTGGSLGVGVLGSVMAVIGLGSATRVAFVISAVGATVLWVLVTFQGSVKQRQ